MPYDDFPDEVSLRFRLHVLCVYAQSTLALMSDLAEDDPKTLSKEDLKALDDAVAELERIWFEVVKIKKQARG
jgi:hypothetical protein